MSSYTRRLALYERAQDLLASRLWPLEASLPRTRYAIFLAHNWIGCRPRHPQHARYEAIFARHNERTEAIRIAKA